MSPWWVTPLGILLTGATGWAAKMWAQRGKSPETLTSLNTVAMGMVNKLAEQVTVLDKKVTHLGLVDDWRAEVHRIDGDHHDVLEAHIWRQKPPPPPARPLYPQRPSA